MIQVDSITTDDIVWNYNVDTKNTELYSIPNIFKRSSFEFVRIWYGGDSVTCTQEHPFFVNNTWFEAKELKAGDPYFMSEDGLRKVRWDWNNTSPHDFRHLHFEVFDNGKWKDAIKGKSQIGKWYKK